MTEPKIKVKGLVYQWRILEYILFRDFVIVYDGAETQMRVRSILNRISTKIFNYHKKQHERAVLGKLPKEELGVSFTEWEFRKFYIYILPVIDQEELGLGFWQAFYNKGFFLTDMNCVEEYSKRKAEYDELMMYGLNTGVTEFKELI